MSLESSGFSVITENFPSAHVDMLQQANVSATATDQHANVPGDLPALQQAKANVPADFEGLDNLEHVACLHLPLIAKQIIVELSRGTHTSELSRSNTKSDHSWNIKHGTVPEIHDTLKFLKLRTST